jgi:AcrR family transcriptional regulator
VPAPTPTRDTILDAAEREFAGRGYAATTIKHLAAAAGVNSALLYYYFTDKETLYREMLRRVLGAFANEGVRRMQGAATPEAAVRQFVALQLEFMSARPHVPRLIVRELVDYDAAHAERGIAHAAAGLFAHLCGVIERGQRAGVFCPDVDARFAAISTIAQVAYLLIARPAVGILLGDGADGPSPETMRAFARHAGDFAVAALAATNRDGAASGRPGAATGERRATARSNGAGNGGGPRRQPAQAADVTGASRRRRSAPPDAP